MSGYSRAWIYEVVRSYNQQGPNALGDQRQHNQGHGQFLLDDELQALLWQALASEPPEGGQWNGRKVADWLSERLGRPVHRQRGWEILKQMEFSLRVPRAEHQQAATEEEQRAWGKKSTDSTRHPQNRPPRSRRTSAKTRPVVNRAANAFRMAAQTLTRSQSALGAFYRRMKS